MSERKFIPSEYKCVRYYDINQINYKCYSWTKLNQMIDTIIINEVCAN